MCTGEETVAPLAGLETHTDPAELEPGFGAGTGAAGGSGATPVYGPTLRSKVIAGHVVAGSTAVAVVSTMSEDEALCPAAHPERKSVKAANWTRSSILRTRVLRQVFTIDLSVSFPDAAAHKCVGCADEEIVSDCLLSSWQPMAAPVAVTLNLTAELNK
jgi:hypothetical protein